MIGSLTVNDTSQDAQLIINKDACVDNEVRLCILNHDEGEAAYIVVDLEDLRRIVSSEELTDA